MFVPAQLLTARVARGGMRGCLSLKKGSVKLYVSLRSNGI